MPTYSEIDIEFLVDLDIDAELKLTTINSGVLTPQTWTWVATRSSGFEVTKGTPTGNAGETTAINYKSAFDLDNASGYVTTQTVNNINIASETLGQDFAGIKIDDENGIPLVEGTDYNVTFINYVAPLDLSTVGTMLSRSPYYITTPFYFDTTTKATIDLKIYDGDFTADEPSTSTQVISKVRPTIDYDEFNTNISRIVSNYLQASPNIPLTSTTYELDSGSNEVKWVRYTASYTDAIEEVTAISGYLIASDGYSEYLDGINKGFSAYLTSTTNRKVSDDGVIILPFVNNGYYSSIVQTSSPTNEDSTTVTLVTSDESTDFVKYIQTDVSQFSTDTRIIYTLNKTAGGSDVITYDIVPECRYEQKTVLFKNKYGFFDTLTMFAKSVETLNVEKKDFVNNYVSNGTYSTSKHQRKDINIFSTKSIVCNSGHIKESETNLYEEMLLSEFVWFYEKGVLNPVKPNTKQLQYKTRVNDGLIEYQIGFDYAYNQINNV